MWSGDKIHFYVFSHNSENNYCVRPLSFQIGRGTELRDRLSSCINQSVSMLILQGVHAILMYV